jgi:phosphoesterase RecJ-like protein
METKKTINKIIEKIKNNKSFLITSHVSLEGDALGSELAMYILLKKLKKKAVIYNHDVTPPNYKFLPFYRVIKHSIAENQFDIALALDCSDSSRAGKVKDYLSRANCIINIDHHISNTYFGDINWIDPKASSTSQMLFELCDKLKIMDRNTALCIYTGIFTDTGNFTYSNTTEATYKILANLMHYNIHPHAIYQHIHSLCEGKDFKFIGNVISSLEFDSRKKICWATIKKWKEKDYDLTEVIFSIMRLLKDVEVFILFKKVDSNKVRINFRSRSYVDVNRIAQFFGGGGHKRASGTTVEDTLEGAKKKVISFVRRLVNGFKLETNVSGGKQ